MSGEASDPIIPTATRVLTPARAASHSGIWPIGLCVVLCWAIFLWASSRGYEFADEAFDLSVIADPASFKGFSNFGDFWHPLYAALNGDIGGLRVAGMLVLSAFGAMFGFAVSRFVDSGARIISTRISVVLGIAVCVFWQHQTWDATPDYNMLNLCAQLLFFSALLESLAPDNEKRVGVYGSVLLPAFLCSAALTVMALTKATSAVLAVVLGVAWIALLPPRRPVASILATVALTTVLFVVAATVMDGGIFAFATLKVRALELLRSPSGGGDVHGITTSLFGVFLKQWWKIAQTALFGGFMFSLALAWSHLATSDSHNAIRRRFAFLCAVAIGIVVMWWRVEDSRVALSFLGFRVWRLPLLMVLLAFVARVLLLTGFPIDRERLRKIFVAGILLLAPAVYSFGTDSLILWHMTGAGIFWAGAMMVIASLLPQPVRERSRQSIAFLCAAASLGMFAGAVIEPGRIGIPLWRQTAAISIGPQASRLSVTPEAAAYIETFQRAAGESGFVTNTPVVDLSEMGMGLTFALGGKSLGWPPWLISDGGIPDEAVREQTIRSQAANAPRYLAAVADSELCAAWVITGRPAYLNIVQSALAARHLNFPDGYRVVARASRSDLGWTQVLWKPKDARPGEAATCPQRDD